MPSIFSEIVTPDISLNVWRIDEKTEDLRAKVILDIEEENYFNSFGNENRKKQWLGYRILLKHLLKTNSVKIRYDEYGKPFIPGSPCNFSVSHSGDYAAAIISTQAKVGIDIEKIGARIERVKERFLSEEELENIGNDQRLEKLHLCWGAKESLYKLYGKPNIDFKTDIALEQFDYLCIGRGIFHARMNLPEGAGSYTLRYQKIEEYMLVYAFK